MYFEFVVEDFEFVVEIERVIMIILVGGKIIWCNYIFEDDIMDRDC